MEETKELVPTPENLKKAEAGREFIASQRAEYNRFTIDIIAQYPVSVGSIIDTLNEHFEIERDAICKTGAKLTIKNLPGND